MNQSIRPIKIIFTLFVFILFSPLVHADTPQTECQMTFTLKSWSIFYKSGKGYGTIKCDNGQKAKVNLRAQGGGLSFGKGKIVNGHGKFSKVASIKELFGDYATAEAHAGVVKSGSAQALTKGEVSLSLTGTGSGIDIGFDFGKFTISKNNRKEKS